MSIRVRLALVFIGMALAISSVWFFVLVTGCTISFPILFSNDEVFQCPNMRYVFPLLCTSFLPLVVGFVVVLIGLGVSVDVKGSP